MDPNKILLGDKSPLRRLPAALEVESRIQLEALVFSCDVALSAYRQIYQFAISKGLEIGKITPLERASFISQCWTIVDQIHAMRGLLRTLSQGKVSEVDLFVTKYERVTHLRNRMDHLGSQTRNIANASGMRPPIFGSLSYFLIDKTNIMLVDGKPTATSGSIVVIPAGSFHNGKQLMAMSSPAGRRLSVPVGLFLFHAFEHTLDIQELFTDLATVIQFVEARFERNSQKQIARIADQTSTREEALKEVVPGNLVMLVEVKFGDGLSEPSKDHKESTPVDPVSST